jgi:hypothetical protein
MIDGTYFYIDLFDLKNECLLDFVLLFAQYMTNLWPFLYESGIQFMVFLHPKDEFIYSDIDVSACV